MSEERKLVTILFADVTNSTALGDTLDPEDIRALMSRYYNHARRVAALYGGTVEKFIGDAVMAVFGLPQTHSDDAERGLAAALALREAVANDDVLGTTFVLRIGVNTGEVIAGDDSSRRDFLVSGDSVNIAARLQQCANPGEIIAGERTAVAARNAFLFDEARKVEVKGKRQPLLLFPLKCKRSMRNVERPPFVGRRQDLLQLSVLCERTLEEQRPQLVSIIAQAGTGKTRLLEEFLQHLDPIHGFQIATVRCPSYGQILTYWPLRGLLIGLLGEDISREKIATAFIQGGYEQSCATEFADLILTALGVEGERTTDRESIFAAWRFLIEVLARQVPRVIIFEDLHWASDSLLDMVEHITNLHAQASLLIITLSRPELLDRRPNWGGGRPNFTSLTLQPLTAVQTRDLVGRLAQDMPEVLREQIIERSGGNPFFALELIRGLSERGLTNTNTSKSLPDTVHAAVLARLDLLTARERAVLQVASIANRTFRTEMVQAVLDQYTHNEIATALDGLLARDLVVSQEVDVYAFRHILIRDVTSGTLSRVERIRLHGKIAAWLEMVTQKHMDEYAELIAYHYHQAVLLSRQSAVPLDLPIEPTRAIRFLRRAGELASRAGAFVEARNHIQSAIDIAPPSLYIQLYEQLGDSVSWSVTAVDAYNKALELWRNTGAVDPLTGARLLRKLLICYTRGSVKDPVEHEQLMTWRAEAQQLARAAGDEDEIWRIRVVDLFFRCSEYTQITWIEVTDVEREIGLEAAAYFERKGNWTAFSEALDGYASYSMHAGEYQDVLVALKRRLAAPDLPAMERGDAIQMIARSYANIGDYDMCIATMNEALASIRPGQPLIHFGSGVSQAIAAAFTIGRWSEIPRFTAILREIVEQFQYDPACYSHKGFLVILQMVLAREDNAAIDATTSILMRLFPDETSNTRILLAALLADDPRKIPSHIAHSNQTLLFYNEHGIAMPEEAITNLLTYHWSSSISTIGMEISKALAAHDDVLLARAIDDAENHHMVVHAARMRIVLAQHTGNRALLERARPVLERLEDRLFLRRLEEVETSLHMRSGI